jgi:thiosulfate/3-mercaptopyruvate sulfurtransferase
MSSYATPESLVETSWLAGHLDDPTIRIVESNEDVLLYDTGHIPNAVHIDWRADLNDPVQRDYITPDAFARLAARKGISPETTVIFYGDKANWWAAGKPLIDVRSPGEFRGEVTHMPEHPQEGVLRGGHIPGARGIPWKTATNGDGTFKSAEELHKIYIENLGVDSKEGTVVYCRIGERSSHTWFVLIYLLGFPRVKNYDGSRKEWGNSVRVPIEKGS